MSELKQINTNGIRIENNIISFEDFLLQISNISNISIEPSPKRKFNYVSIILLIAGIVMFQIEGMLQGIGVLLIMAVVIYVFLFWAEKSSNDARYLYLWMNSGNNYYIYCKDTLFLKQIMKVMEYCFNNHYSQAITIDLSDCKMYNSPIIIGDNNEVI